MEHFFGNSSCLACKGLTCVGLADCVTHCLDEGKSNRKGSLKKVPVQRGPNVHFLWPSPRIFCICFYNLLNCSSMVFRFADCCRVLILIPVVEALSFGKVVQNMILAEVQLLCPWPLSTSATQSLLPTDSPFWSPLAAVSVVLNQHHT